MIFRDLSLPEDLNSPHAPGAQWVDTQGILLGVQNRDGPALQPVKLLFFKIGLEDRILHSVSKVLQQFRDLEAAVIVGDIVADRIKHVIYQQKV